jgi:hypothetical protein
MNFTPNKPVIIAAKVALFVLLLWFMARTIFAGNDIAAQWQLFVQSVNNANKYLLIPAVCLMPLNWLLEIYKWKVLLKDEPQSFSNLCKGVLAGVTFGFVTPGRAGEFVGRAFYSGGGSRTRVFYLSTIGGIAQTAVTLVCGVIFLSFWSGSAFLNGVAIGLSAVFLLLYFRFDLLNRALEFVPLLKRNQLTITASELPGINTLGAVLLLSLLRYGVYLAQYALVFALFGISSQWLALFVHSGVLLLAQTFSPFIPLVDVAFRGSAALYVYGNLTGNHLGVITAALLVWLINLAAPAMLGYIFILRKKVW